MNHPPGPAPARSLIRSMLPTGRLRENLVLAACLALFLIYGSFRQRYVWGVDSYGYYQLGKLFSEGRLFLPVEWSGSARAALVPLGFSLAGGGLHAVPNYPPGFPLLVALGQLVRAPMWVTPFLGVVSCLVLFALLRDRVREGTTWLFTLAWAFMPLTVYGSTLMMSDLVAATTLMGGLLSYRRGHVAAAAWIFGLSIAVRPTNLLFFAPFALVLRPDRRTLLLALHLAAPCALYGWYNSHLYGAPWRTGYGDVWGNLRPEFFPAHFAFYLTAGVAILSPLIAALAVCGLVPWTREKLFLALWPGTLVVFYSFWAGGGIDRWWWARFILPGLGAVFLLAAGGFETAGRWFERWWPGARAGLARMALGIAVFSLPLYYVHYGRSQNDLWQRDTGSIYYEVVRRVGLIAPPGSLVGSVELTSTFRLYSGQIPFVPIEATAPDLIGQALAQGRRVYLIPEPWNATHPVILEIERRFQAREIARFDFIWNGLPVLELSAR
ncbi:MAG: hypothetical protein HY302_14365 [Opitutae bacterium]|nr:hypothetical protein [Opitutae bacterium]